MWCLNYDCIKIFQNGEQQGKHIDCEISAYPDVTDRRFPY